MFLWRSMCWLGGFSETGCRVKIIWRHVTLFLMTLKFVWPGVVVWKQQGTCSSWVLFSSLCGTCLDFEFVYLQLIRSCYSIILFNLLILREGRVPADYSYNLFGYVVFQLCGVRGIIEFLKLRIVKLHPLRWLKAYNANIGVNSHIWWSNPFVCLGIG
jgi:hypothetical protein